MSTVCVQCTYLSLPPYFFRSLTSNDTSLHHLPVYFNIKIHTNVCIFGLNQFNALCLCSLLTNCLSALSLLDLFFQSFHMFCSAVLIYDNNISRVMYADVTPILAGKWVNPYYFNFIYGQVVGPTTGISTLSSFEFL